MAEPILTLDKLSVGYTDEPVVVDVVTAYLDGPLTAVA